MDVERAFKTNGYVFTDAEAVKQCKLIAEEHSLKASEVAEHYDTYAAVRDSSLDVSANHVAAFAKFLAKELAASAKAKMASTARPHIIARTWEEPQDFRTPKRAATGNGPTPKAGLSPIAPPATSPTAGTPLNMTPGNTHFTSRQNKGQVVCSYNDQLTLPAKASSQAPPSLQLLGEQLVVPGVKHLHMMDTLEGKVHAVNERILSFGDAIRRMVPEAADINQTSVTEVSQEPVWVVGRIVSEAETGALNEQSVLLEGSREASAGARVRLDLSHLPSYRLFPGQVVGAKGLNPTGAAFVAQQLITHCPQARPSTGAPSVAGASSSAAAAPGEVAAPQRQPSARGLSMVIAAGPLTTADNMRFEPFDELLGYCAGNSVDQVLLLGPFVDAEHPMVREGLLSATFDQVFRDEVARRLAAWQERNPSCQVLLVPSVRDVHLQPVFPQPPVPLEGGLGERLRSLQNPCAFASEGLVVAASSQDVLKHLVGCEVARGQQAQDSMAARASHLVGQRSFYPVFPAPPGACLDTSHYSALQLPCSPDLLLLPSDLAPFAKTVSLAPSQLQGGPLTAVPGAPEAVIAVNPGRLAKGVSGGTFAHVQLAPAGAQAALPTHQLLRVDIRRI